MEQKIILVKEKENKQTSAVFVDNELLDGIRDIKNETGISIQKIVEKFIRFGLENYEIVEE
ncbi:hypothetical protein NHG28_06430 [Aerococcaceae bacterium NML201209]|nr:hypothetical protein [Aerococcaceae bacterium NML201209]MCW6680850.1 hypothetical protein [Aerococcaceae bacterium NML130460]